MLVASFNIAYANTETEIQGACDILSDLGIMQGDENGNLGELKNLTRAEFCALVTRIMKEQGIATVHFSDVPDTHWAVPYIGLMTQKGIVNGFEDGSFRPENNVTFAQAVKILLGILGKAEENLSYPDGYLLKGAQSGITKGITVSADAALIREDAARLILNAIYIPDKNNEMLIEKLDVKTYYVSTFGSDTNDGSISNPFKTIAAAAEKASGNAVIFLNDGTYEMTESVTINSGESSERPLVIRTALGADVKVVLSGDAQITANEFVNIKGFEISQSEDNDTPRIIAEGKNIVLENNIISSAPVLVKGDACKVLENTFEGKKTLLTVEGANTEICANTFNGQMETSLFVKGGANNAKIYSNTFNISPMQIGSVIVVGEKNGEAVKNCVMLNNVIYDGEYNEEALGVTFAKTESTYVYNNIIDGAKGAVKFAGENSGVTLKNNIYLECGDNCYVIEKMPAKFVSDYNCFYETYPKNIEKNSFFTDPYVVSRGGDWHLMADSPIISAGTQINEQTIGADGEMITLDLSDFDGMGRNNSYNMGIYAASAAEATEADEDAERIILSLDFKKGADHLTMSGGEWKTERGTLRQVKEDTPRTTVIYDGGLGWGDYEYSADVESPNTKSGNATGIIFRCDKDMENMYTFRFLNPGMLEFAKWQNGSFASIEKWNADFSSDTIYNMKVIAVGNKFVFYINGEKVREVEDNSYKTGTVGLYCYREANSYDNMKVLKVEQAVN